MHNRKMGRPSEIKGKPITLYLGKSELELLEKKNNKSAYIRELIRKDNENEPS